MGKSDTDRCQSCVNQQEGISPIESVNHFLFDCPAHHIAREELIEEIGLDNFHLVEIMADTNRLKALTTYINRTRRFRD
jgi:hypothetical protein